MLFPVPVSADADNMKKAENLLEILDADMGRTEIGQAITAAVKGKKPTNFQKRCCWSQMVRCWEWEKVVSSVARSG